MPQSLSAVYIHLVFSTKDRRPLLRDKLIPQSGTPFVSRWRLQTARLPAPPRSGYADFSVSRSNLEPVNQYIAGQEEHRRKLGFQDELRALLREHEIEWDEKYVWD
jgi:hypothetical protein